MLAIKEELKFKKSARSGMLSKKKSKQNREGRHQNWSKTAHFLAIRFGYAMYAKRPRAQEMPHGDDCHGCEKCDQHYIRTLEGAYVSEMRILYADQRKAKDDTNNAALAKINRPDPLPDPVLGAANGSFRPWLPASWSPPARHHESKQLRQTMAASRSSAPVSALPPIQSLLPRRTAVEQAYIGCPKDLRGPRGCPT